MGLRSSSVVLGAHGWGLSPGGWLSADAAHTLGLRQACPVWGQLEQAQSRASSRLSHIWDIPSLLGLDTSPVGPLPSLSLGFPSLKGERNIREPRGACLTPVFSGYFGTRPHRLCASRAGPALRSSWTQAWKTFIGRCMGRGPPDRKLWGPCLSMVTWGFSPSPDTPLSVLGRGPQARGQGSKPGGCGRSWHCRGQNRVCLSPGVHRVWLPWAGVMLHPDPPWNAPSGQHRPPRVSIALPALRRGQAGELRPRRVPVPLPCVHRPQPRPSCAGRAHAGLLHYTPRGQRLCPGSQHPVPSSHRRNRPRF